MNEICGCCEGIKKITPEPIENRPGLSKLSYRVGTHASFLETMMASLSTNYLEIPSGEFDDQGNLKTTTITPLRSLAVRTNADTAIALLDAWATVADVLTFYQERIANEGYLRTATERRSILELARLVGYALRPGVAASAYLAYTLDDGYKVTINAGSRSQSIPGPGELPQFFETSKDLDTRADWNILRPRTTRPKLIKPDFVMLPAHAKKSKKAKTNIEDLIDTLYFKGLSTNLQPNDPLFFLFPHADSMHPNNPKDPEDPRLIRHVLAVDPQAAEDRTKVVLQGPQKSTETPKPIIKIEELLHGKLLVPPSRPPASPLDLEQRLTDTFSDTSDVSLQMITKLNPLLENTLYPALANAQVTDTTSQASILAFKVKAAPFGHNVPKKPIFDDKGAFIGQEEWPINDTEEIAVRIFSFDAEMISLTSISVVGDSGKSFGIMLSVKQGSEILSKQVLLASVLENDEGVVSLDGENEITVKIISEDKGLSFIFNRLGAKGDRKKEIRLTSETDGNSINVQIDGNTIVDDLGIGGIWRSLIDGRKINVAYLLDKTSINISVSDESYLPLVPKNVICLDAEYGKILSGSWVVIDRPSPLKCIGQLKKHSPVAILGELGKDEYIIRIVRKVISVSSKSRADYGITATVTQLTLDNDWLCDEDLLITVLRGTTVYAQSEPLELAEDPVGDPICMNDIELDGVYNGLQAGKWLIVSGERTDIPGTSGVMASEPAMLIGVKQSFSKDLPDDKYHTTLRLAADLEYCYRRDTVTIYGNVADATHGETHTETLGSGDASKPGQRFTLHQSPLTFVSAVTPSGIESTLKISVDDIFWHESDSLAGLEPTDRRYITQRGDDDKTTVIFGDGQHGARLQTGVENIRAVYRTGIGKLGNVKARQISQLMTRPLGVRSVINPMPATGGADRESQDQARRNVPLALMALDRLISVRDYADFARTFGGIGKASSAKQSDGRRQIVHVTIAGEDDIPIDSNSDLHQNLLKALRNFGDPDQPIQVDMRNLVMLVMGAKVKVLPDYQWSSIKPKVQAALLDTFSFGNRDLGQDALLSEAISATQRVPGVAYVDIDIFGGIPEKDSSGNPLAPADIATKISTLVNNGPSPRVIASPAYIDGGIIHPAQIAYLVPSIKETLQLTELK